MSSATVSAPGAGTASNGASTNKTSGAPASKPTWAQLLAGKNKGATPASASKANDATSSSSSATKPSTKEAQETASDSLKSSTAASPISTTAGDASFSSSSGGGSGHASMTADTASTSMSSAPSGSAAPSTAAKNSDAPSLPSEGSSTETPPAPPKQPSGPPKVNIWQVRKEQAAQKLQEQQAQTQTSSSSSTAGASSAQVSSSGEPIMQPATNQPKGNKGKKQPSNQNAEQPASNKNPRTPIKDGKGRIHSTGQNGKTTSNAVQALPDTSDASSWPSPAEEKTVKEKQRDEKQQGKDDAQSVAGSSTNGSNEKKKANWVPIQAEITFNTPPVQRGRNGQPSTSHDSRPVNTSTSQKTDSRSRAGSKDSRASPVSTRVVSPTEDKSVPLAHPNGPSSRRPSQTSSSAPPPPSHNLASGQKFSQGPSRALSPIPASGSDAGSAAVQPEAQVQRTPQMLHASLPAKPLGAPTASDGSLSPTRHRLSPVPPQHAYNHRGSFHSPGPTPNLSNASTTTEGSVGSAPSGSANASGDDRARMQAIMDGAPNAQYLNNGPGPTGPYQQSNYRGTSKRGGPGGRGRGGMGRGGYAGPRNNAQNQYKGGMPAFPPQQYGPNGYFDPTGQQAAFYGNPPGAPGFFPAQPFGAYGQQGMPYFIPGPGMEDMPHMQNGASSASSQAGSPPVQTQMLPFPPQPMPGFMPPEMQGMAPYNPYAFPQAFQAPPPFVERPRPAPMFSYEHIQFPPDGTAYWVLGQTEFYMSPDNLARDVFLRQNMDEEGWIDIALIASFNRMKQLSTDINLIREMMNVSHLCEVREIKVRPREWQRWVMPGARKVDWGKGAPQPQQPHQASQQQPASQQQTAQQAQ